MGQVIPVPAAIVFDMDGVLVNTEDLGFAAHAEVLRELHGAELTVSAYKKWIGRNPPFGERLEDVLGRRVTDPAQVGRFESKVKATIERLCNEQLALMAGVAEFLARCDAALRGRMAIASSSHVDEIERRLRQVGLRDLFTIIVSAKEVARPKPAKDVYVEALRRLGLAAAAGSCIAVEDTQAGARSAIDAELQVIVARNRFTLDSDMPEVMLDLGGSLHPHQNLADLSFC